MKYFFLALFSLSIVSSGLTQGAAINDTGNPPDQSAGLDVSFEDRGFLPPRLSSVQRDNISNPADGLTIYNTTLGCLEYFRAGQWYSLCGICPGPATPVAAAHITSGSQITWNWQSINNVDGYKWNTINDYGSATDIGNTTSYVQTGLSCNGPQQTLYVWAYNTCGYSAFPGVLTASPATSPVVSPITGVFTVTASLTTQLSNATPSGTWGTSNAAIATVSPTGLVTGESAGTAIISYTVTASGCSTTVNQSVVVQAQCLPFTVTHTAGNTAPVTKTVTYGVVLTSISGAEKCWITQNLGASNQATEATDATEAAAGWYWQFNRKQGMKHDGSTLTPAWPGSSITESSAWTLANDPCAILLGSGWRIPTISEWATIDGPPQNWISINSAFASVLKVHAAGRIIDGGLDFRGSDGRYWSSTQASSSTASYIQIGAGDSYLLDIDKGRGHSVRCLRD